MESRRPSAGRDRLVATAARVMARRGYHATAVADVLTAAGVPSGVLYHHFGSKEMLAAAAVARAGREVAAVFQSTPGGVRERLCGLIEHWERRLRDSDFAEGCPIACSALEAASASPELREAAARVYEEWIGGLEAGLRSEGRPGEQARSVAVTALSIAEGALLLAQTLRSTEPMVAARTAIGGLLDSGRPA